MIEVKELEWRKERIDMICARPHDLLRYTVRRDCHRIDRFRAYANGGIIAEGTRTEADAKAACQADFSRRVLTCVTVSEADIRADERERLARWFEESDTDDFYGAQIGYLIRSIPGARP